MQDRGSGLAWGLEESQDTCLAAIEQPRPSQTRGTTPPTLRRTPARGTVGLTRRFVEAPVATQHVQTQKRKPEQPQGLVAPEDDEIEVKHWM